MKAWTIMAAAVAVLGIGPAAASAQSQARPLTPAERRVCSTAEHCADILSRHGPSAFDYGVLAQEMKRFGPQSAPALAKLANGKAAPNLVRLADMADPALALDIGLRLSASSEAAEREIGHIILREDDVQAARLGQPYPLAATARLLSEAPSPLVIRLLEQHPFEAARPHFERALASGDADVVTAAYQRLFDASPQTAFDALVAQMRGADDLPTALAIGAMLARRDADRADGFYAKMLDDIAADRGYSQAMRDGARAGSMGLARRDAPLTITADLGAQLARIAEGAPSAPLFTPQVLQRGGDALLSVWTETAQSHPPALPAMLDALRESGARADQTAPFIAQALRGAGGTKALRHALALIALPDVGRWEAPLQTIARTHPFGDIRFHAQALLDRDVTLDARSLMDGRASSGLQASRKRADYCERGRPIAAAALNAQMPTFEDGTLGLPKTAQVERAALRSAFPGRTRWLAGYARGDDGSLTAFDYTTGQATLIGSDPVQLIAPVRPAPLGRQPDALWVVTDAVAHRIAPDGETVLRDPIDLPGPVRQVFRLPDASLLLHFHDATAAFQPDIIGGEVRPGWVADHPPLRLTPDGALTPGCEGEALAGDRPSLFRP